MAEGGFELREAPISEVGVVKAWEEAVVIPTYEPRAPERHPMFLEKRVYQGSSGRVYPLPFVDRIAEEKTARAWRAVHIENEFVRVMILPELGGRIHVGLDKTNGYDFFYRQNVIKPALVGLAGPWISGGVEFNWPQHHRPSTFMETACEIERHGDGSVTVWCREIEPMTRMLGAHGVCLHPGRGVIELKARVHNRTEVVQTFLWWANVAVKVHERYQSFFPPDVTYVADHAKRAMSRFPHCEGVYYGVDYAKRAREGVPAEERPRKFLPPPPPGEMYAANDLSWYANIPVPTSYMAMGSKEDFFGGYDHAVEAGLVHVADHHIAPGKKQWTWGNHEFGYAWDRHLSEDEAPYIELMAGVFTDNQPDFSYLMPGEKRAWSQYWYPIQKIGPAQQANVDAAMSLRVEGARVRVGIVGTRVFSGARVRVWARGEVVAERVVDISPGVPFVEWFDVGAGVLAREVRAELVDALGRGVISYQPAEVKRGEVPAAAREPAVPGEVKTAEELYLIGAHLEQYRHATRMPEAYWGEALRRDPADSRCNTAMGWWHFRRGEFEKAVGHFGRAVETLTRFNPNPREGEAYYGLGVALARAGGRREEAEAALRKACWNGAWREAAEAAIARLGDGGIDKLPVTGERDGFRLFPSTLDDLAGLEATLRETPQDARAHYDMGNWLYDRRRREEAIGFWERAVRIDRLMAGAWRNLGIAYFNVYKDVLAAKGAYERAFQGAPEDARIFYERDQLWKRTGVEPTRRLEMLEAYPALVGQRDDLTIELCTLLNQVGRSVEAVGVLEKRRFQPWEGGEGLVLGQWARGHVALGRLALARKDVARAVGHFEAGLAGRENLGEAWHLLANRSELHYWAGMAYRAAGDRARGDGLLRRAAEASGDFRDMAVCAYSETSYFSALALLALDRGDEAQRLFEAMGAYARALAGKPATIDYFATSLPTLLLFDDDLQRRQNTQATLLEALAMWGTGDRRAARRLLGDIVRDDPNHAVAADFLQSIEWSE